MAGKTIVVLGGGVGGLVASNELRKRLAAFCLCIVIIVVLFGLQVSGWFGLPTNAFLFALAALFSYRVYRTPVRFGWL